MVLQAIRERLTGIIAIFIFAILIIPFAFVGVNSYFTSDSVNSVARVNDVDISVNDYSQGFQNYRRRMQSLMGARFDPEQFDQPIVRRQFLDSLIDKELLAQVSLEVGLSVDDQRLAQAIREIPAFQVDGEFNTDVYQSRLLAQGTTPQEFENDMRAQLILEQFPGTITASAIATDWELQQFVRLQDQQRSFKALLVKAETEDEEAVGDMESVAEELDEAAEETLEEAVDAAEEAIAEAALEESEPQEPADSSSPVAEEAIVA
ncbi:MAG TPA: SurA N-terminal domain-containing protein, partial [Xanthomonadales bacterium]|nr:SurA N-terminal domain-containing protein [Xanthomonadales bacterium]